MFDPKQILPIVQAGFPKAKPEQLMEALEKLAKAHPDLTAMQALAALQKYVKERQQPSIGMMARQGALR